LNVESKTYRTGKRGKANKVSHVTGNAQPYTADKIQQEADKKLASVENALRERIKELGCLYGIAQLMERHENSLDRLLQGTADLLPPSWQYPEVACARIIYEENSYMTAGYRETRYKQSADITVNRKRVGVVEVCYTKKMPRSDEGPFLKEERALINAVAERLGKAAEKMRAEEELREAHTQLQVERRALQEANSALRAVLARIEDEKSAIKEAIIANVEKIIMPILHTLEAEIVGPEKQGYVRLLRRNLEEITSPLVDRLSRRFLALTPSELRICNMIRMGFATKEIARLRHIAPSTVSRHRESVRRKLGLVGKNVNLITYLQTFEASASRMVQRGRLGLDAIAQSTLDQPDLAGPSSRNQTFSE
jgi:DNA-binding CsgD family transcriptional regulator